MLGRTSGDFCGVVHFWCCIFSFIFICQCFSFCWCCIFISFPGSFAMSPALHPGYSDPWRSSPALSSTLTTFDCLFFFIYRECYGFEWTFLPTGVFYLTLLPDILAHSQHFSTVPTFWHNLLLSRFHWGPAATFLKVAGLHNGPRNTDPAHLFVWFTVIHNILYILSQYFIHLNVNIAKVLLVVKCLIRSAATLFSSHENIKQQLN